MRGDPARIATLRASLDERLAATVATVWRELDEAGRLRDGAAPPRLSVPPSFADVLARTAALDEADGGVPSDAVALRLRTYTELMPRLRIEQLASSDPTSARLFHTPLDWRRLPRLSSLVERLYELCAEAGVSPASPFGEPTAPAFRAARPTLGALYARTYYGSFMPLLNAYPNDLAVLGRLLDGGATVEAVIDRYLAAPLAHELAHAQPSRAALFPPYLDESIAGWIGALALPDFAFPADGEDNAIFAAPWLLQVGQAMGRAFGAPRIVRAHLGGASWDDMLPAGARATFERLGWSEYRRRRDPHFLSSTLHPDPWLKLFFLLAASDREPRALDAITLDELDAIAWRDIPAGAEVTALDEAMLRDGLQAMCVEAIQVDGVFRVRRKAPREIGIAVEDCRVSAPASESGLDPAPPAYLLPPAVAARWRARGIARITVELDGGHGLDAIPSVVAALRDGQRGERGAGFRVRCDAAV